VRRVVVVGSGVAGTAAALAAAREGARVTMLGGGTGASVLAGGALDDVPWDKIADESPSTLEEQARYVLDALDAYAVLNARALVAATTGILRPARGVDRALLDLASLSSTKILVPDLAHLAWDAPALCRAWNASRRAEARRLSFVPVTAGLLARTDEQRFSDAEVAELHDDETRLDWLAQRLRELRTLAGGDGAAILLPPWLGVAHARAARLSEQVGCRCGEALGGVGGPSGLRFERARDRALGLAGVTVVNARATRVTAAEGAWRVDTRASAPEASYAGDAVVLATGGLVGGGLEYTPSGASFANDLPAEPRPLLRSTLDAPVTLGAFGRPLDDASSLFGSAPETHVWPHSQTPLLDHAGIRVDASGHVIAAPQGLFATGEVAAGPVHTWLSALTHGARAGAAAAVPTGTGVPRRT
jgi:glycerol-3-phosphate dehydrogenase subunit B